MTPILHYECTRLPVTALASCGALLVAAEGPFLRFYHAKTSRFIASKRVFGAQAVHGISAYSDSCDVIKLVIWGGCLIRALEVNHYETELAVYLSAVTKSPDWILDLAPRFSSLEDAAQSEQVVCVAVTAHNALLQVIIHRKHAEIESERVFALSLSELTSSSRSILYSAHVFWESKDCVLVAAGTAFGEIMYWSWNGDTDMGPTSRVHRVFLGHEGSIFGVRISKELPSGCCQSLKRIIASCSDDRTIRIWDVSDVAIQDRHTATLVHAKDSERLQHTGFSNAAFDANPFSSLQCLAIGWAHASRVWTVQFLESTPCEGALLLVSTGEDASSRTWKLSLDKSEGAILPYQLLQQDSAANHSGKNIWSSAIYGEPVKRQRIVCGAADSKITSHPLIHISDRARESRVQEYTVPDILSLAQISTQQPNSAIAQQTHKSSKKTEFFRSYCFLNHESFLLTTNSGNVLVGSLQAHSTPKALRGLTRTVFIDRPSDLSGYSVCTGETTTGVAFVAGSTGNIYMYSKSSNTLSKIRSFDAKIGELFARYVPQRNLIALLVTLVGKKEAQLLYVDVAAVPTPFTSQTIIIPLSELSNGSMITSMALTTTTGISFLHLGLRRGSIVVYSVSQGASEDNHRASLFRVIESVHGQETVTALQWFVSPQDPFTGHLVSVGRDGCLAIQYVDLHANLIELVHNVTLPIGPNIEGLYFHQGHLLLHGFSSKKWVLYDVTVEDEIMGVETGGAHRSWAFQPDHESQGGGTLVWTRASSMHIRSQTGPDHSVIRSGGHGREIKAVAVSQGPYGQLIATGAEDTDIKIFEYVDGELQCRRTLRRHTTGIQHLKWSEDGNYLFSSGGCEEFYIWRIRQLPAAMGIGIVCELTYAPESEHADLRIMSFDVQKRGMNYEFAMVFSDSSIKVYQYSPLATVKWQPLAQGLYFTSCLTQCVFLSTESFLTAGTDGHTVVWPLSSEGTRTSADSTTLTLAWQQPVRIHQSSSKAMDSRHLGKSTKLVVSGGDDGSIAILLFSRTLSARSIYTAAPVLLSRTHASAVTACAILTHQERVFIITSGNDQWLRLWEVCICDSEDDTSLPAACRYDKRIAGIQRMGKIKTNVADVSSIAVLGAEEDEEDARVLVCGVGMEVVRLEWNMDIAS